MSFDLQMLSLVGRSKPLFNEDILCLKNDLFDLVQGSSFLVIGGAGSIGQAVTLEIFKRDPKVLHIVDINENNMKFFWIPFKDFLCNCLTYCAGSTNY